MSDRLKQTLAERRKAIAAVVTAGLSALVYVVTGINLDDGTATALAGLLIGLVVHTVPNAPSATVR